MVKKKQSAKSTTLKKPQSKKKNTNTDYSYLVGAGLASLLLGIRYKKDIKKFIMKLQYPLPVQDLDGKVYFTEQLKALNFIDPDKIVFDPSISGSWSGGGSDFYRSDYIAKKYKEINISKYFYDLSISTGNLGVTTMINKENTFVPIDKTIDNIRLAIKKSFYDSTSKKKSIQLIYMSFSVIKGGHANTIIINHLKKEIEIFEPHGKGNKDFNDHILSIFKYIFKESGYKVNYFYCQTYNEGLQSLDNKCDKEKYSYTSHGFCGAWSIFFMEAQAANPGSSIKDLVKKIKILLGNYHCEFIRAYSSYIGKYQDIHDIKDFEYLNFIKNIENRHWVHDKN